ncbi:hypothetical protein A3K78_08115 [Candidatus Bathyarchaeota archaeon RBG_13_52_12]|nr:MAG: hypothetical protein A3K78_08115 [Candidatus Bathyarchaeota archaeon RBG_13_52_12]
MPAYDEEANIAKVVLRAQKHVDQVIVCDDGSSDCTADIAEALGAFVIRHEKNEGYGASLMSLFKEAIKINADVVVTLDSDGQHDPKEIPMLLEKLNGDVDIVVGSRFVKGGSSEASGWRNWGIRFINKFINNGPMLISDSQSGFRAYNKRALTELVLSESGMAISTEILLKAGRLGLHTAETPIHVEYNSDSSTYNPILHGVDVVLNTLKHISLHHPLTFYGLPGLLSVLASLFFWVWLIEEYSRSKALLTNVALLGMGSMLVGLMLITTAVILWVMTSLIRENKAN